MNPLTHWLAEMKERRMQRLTRYAGLIAGASLLAAGLGGCATPQKASARCGSFDTELLKTDLESPLRTDPEWYESIIKELARQLDCERSKGPGQ